MRIHELPSDVVRKIAAGEVVTGCYSVIKELIENSIDAKASLIEIEIKSGGKEYMKIKDNGFGMTGAEARIALRPHTTSKILAIDDLESLSTFGFRGEALSTIASVSRLQLSSRTSGSDLGSTLEVVAGEVTDEKFFTGSNGTSIEVFDLLFNTPARRKFMKSAAIEGRMVTEMVQRFILSFVEVDFVYKRDSQLIYDTRGSSGLEERAVMIYPELSKRELLSFSESHNGISIRGLVTLPSRTRRNRMGENIFVNGRYIRQFELNYALERGYGESLEKGNFPFAVVFIELDPSDIDVNIHPQKLEVKFASNTVVLDNLKRAVRSAIHGAGSFTIDILDRPDRDPSGLDEKIAERVNERPERNKSVREDFSGASKIRQMDYPKRQGFSVENEAMPVSIERRFFRAFENSAESRREAIEAFEAAFVGVFGERYLIAESQNGLLIIDQHAAHERILFERLRERPAQASQKLLMAIELKFESTKTELLLLKEKQLEQLGFNLSIESDRIFLTAIPQTLSSGNAVETLEEILDEMRLEGLEEPEKVFDNLLAMIACKAAVRTGDKLDIEQARELFGELKERELLVCPHGRPISMVIRREDLDRYFSR